MCDCNYWIIEDKLFELRDYQKGNLFANAAPILKLVVVTCGNCGNTILINGKVSDLYYPYEDNR